MQVTSIVACMLEAGSDAIVGHLFGDCDLLGWLLNAPAHCEPEPRSGDTRCVPLLPTTSETQDYLHAPTCAVVPFNAVLQGIWWVGTWRSLTVFEEAHHIADVAARERTPLRAGYMGHLTEIANSLQTVAARRPPIAHLLCASTAWTDFAFGPLAERNQVRLLAALCTHLFVVFSVNDIDHVNILSAGGWKL